MDHLHIAVVITCTKLDPDIGMLADSAFHGTKEGQIIYTRGFDAFGPHRYSISSRLHYRQVFVTNEKRI